MGKLIKKRKVLLVESPGYTLIELLAALSIITVVLSSVYGVFSAGISSWDRAFNESEALMNARTTLKILSRDIKNIVAAEPFLLKNMGKIDREFFYLAGSESNLEMICYSRPVSLYWPEDFPRRSDLCKVSYYFEALNEDSEKVVLKRKVTWDKAVLPWKEEEVEILDGVTALVFSYCTSGDWVAGWNTVERAKRSMGFRGLLPSLIKVKATGESGGVRSRTTVLETTVGVTVYEQ